MPFTFKQADSAQATSAAFSGVSTSGDLVIGAFGALMATNVAPISVTVFDTAGTGNVYVQAGPPTAGIPFFGFFLFIYTFYCNGIAAGASPMTVGVTFSPGALLSYTSLLEYGVPVGAVVDPLSYAAPNGSGTVVDVNTTLTQALELLVCFEFFTNASGGSPGAGWSERNYTTTYLMSVDQLAGGAAGPNALTPGNQSPTGPWGAVFLAFYVPSPLIPNVVGDFLSVAEAAIVASGFIVGTVTYSSSLTVPYGHIISQIPVAGSTESPGTAVNLTVSNGPPIPNVVGNSLTVAEAAIAAAGFGVGVVTYASSVTVPSGNVVSQSPIAGSTQTPGTLVNLTISTGPPIPPPSGATDGWPGGWIPG